MRVKAVVLFIILLEPRLFAEPAKQVKIHFYKISDTKNRDDRI